MSRHNITQRAELAVKRYLENNIAAFSTETTVTLPRLDFDGVTTATENRKAYIAAPATFDAIQAMTPAQIIATATEFTNGQYESIWGLDSDTVEVSTVSASNVRALIFRMQYTGDVSSITSFDIRAAAAIALGSTPQMITLFVWRYDLNSWDGVDNTNGTTTEIQTIGAEYLEPLDVFSENDGNAYLLVIPATPGDGAQTQTFQLDDIWITVSPQDTTTASGPPWIGLSNIRRGIENRDTQEDEGEESSLKTYPLIRIMGATAEPVLPFRGNWNVSLEVTFEDMAKDNTDATHEERAGQLFDLLCTLTIANDLSAAIPNFYCGRVVPGQQGYRIEDGRWVSYLPLTMMSCCAASMS